jgi:PKD repeat protein
MKKYLLLLIIVVGAITFNIGPLGGESLVTVENLNIPPIAVIGENIKAKILLKNASASGWTGQLDILLTGPEEMRDKTPVVTVQPGQTVLVIKNFTLTKEGIYTLSVGDKSATLRVLRPSELNTPGDIAIYYTRYYSNMPFLGVAEESREYCSATVYRGLTDYRGYRCMKWQTLDVKIPDSYFGYSYALITPDESESRQVAIIHYQPTQIIVMSFDPPAKNWTWPATSFTSDWSNFLMMIKMKRGEKEQALVISGKARFRVELWGTEIYRTSWGADEEVEVVKIYTDIENAEASGLPVYLAPEFTGKTIEEITRASGTIRLTRYLSGGIVLKEEEDVRISLSQTIIAYSPGSRIGSSTSGDLSIKYTSDMLCYNTHWLGSGGNPSYHNYLIGYPEPSANIPPVARFTYSPRYPTIDETIQFTDLSTDLDGTIVSHLWDFGDGTTSTLQSPTKKYTSAGNYTVTLAVTDSGGISTRASKIISVVTSRQATAITISPANFTVRAGSSITLTATLRDSAGTPIPRGTISWSATAGSFSATNVPIFEGRAVVTYTAPDFATVVTVVASFPGDGQFQASQGTATGIVVLPELAMVIENLTASLRDLKFSVDNLTTEISKLAEAISEGKVAVSVTVRMERETKQVEIKKDFQHEQIQAQVEVKGNNVIAKVSSENREGRTLILNIDNYVLPIINVQHVKVEVDGSEIPMAESYEDVLDPTNDADQAEYLILVGGRGIQVLVSIPHFSTRTITIRGPIAAAPTAWTPLLVAVGIVVVVLILLFAFRRRSRIAG